jgi:hypothetical protein
MSELLKNIDARTRLAGANKPEILLFSLVCAAPDFSGHGFGVKPCQEKGPWNAE